MAFSKIVQGIAKESCTKKSKIGGETGEEHSLEKRLTDEDDINNFARLG